MIFVKTVSNNTPQELEKDINKVLSKTITGTHSSMPVKLVDIKYAVSVVPNEQKPELFSALIIFED